MLAIHRFRLRNRENHSIDIALQRPIFDSLEHDRKIHSQDPDISKAPYVRSQRRQIHRYFLPCMIPAADTIWSIGHADGLGLVCRDSQHHTSMTIPTYQPHGLPALQ